MVVVVVVAFCCCVVVVVVVAEAVLFLFLFLFATSFAHVVLSCFLHPMHILVASSCSSSLLSLAVDVVVVV